MRRTKKDNYTLYFVGTIEIKPSRPIYAAIENSNELIRIKKGNALNALDGDRVKVYVLPRRKSKEKKGQVIEIIKRAREQFAGVLEKHKHFAYFYPDDDNIAKFYIPNPKIAFADGDKAVVRLLNVSERYHEHCGEIVKVLGKKGENEVEMQSILANNDFTVEFPKEVIKQANKINFDIKTELSKRKDFRKVVTFTIDPADAKDFDDALSIRKMKNGNYEVGVHIADVSYFVKPGSELDKEAYKRATSVYLVDRTDVARL